ncbi:hypothetical protein JKP27_16975 [Vibrio vulnificus]|nr:hypothetical protein [Vibrio vulnificus]
MPEAAFGNVLTTTDNDESETNNTGNEALEPSHGARYLMGPRFREDDGVRELIRTTSNTNNKALKPSYSARYTIALRVRENDLVIESMVNRLSLPHTTDNSRANKDGNIEASLDDCLISPFLITPSIVPLNTIFY